MFRRYARCIHCGCELDLFGFDQDGVVDCNSDDGFVGVHDYDIAEPMGIER